MHSPEVTTSVNSSAHCGFSGGIGPPYSARRRRSDTVRRVPEILEVERYRAFSPSGRSGGTSPGCGWSTPATAGAARRRAGSGAALAGRSFTAARRRGKLMLLDTGRRPDPRAALRHDRRPRGRRCSRRSTACATDPGVFDQKWVRARVDVRRRRRISSSTTPAASARWSSRPTRAGSAPTPSTCTRSVSWRPPWPWAGAQRHGGAAEGPADGPGAPGRRRQPAGRRDPVAGRPATRDAPHPAQRRRAARRLHRSLRSTLRQLDRRGGSHMGDLWRSATPAAAARATAPSCGATSSAAARTWWCPVHQR